MDRFAIVPKIIQIILNPCIVWKVHYCGKKAWETIFFQKNNNNYYKYYRYYKYYKYKYHKFIGKKQF